MIKGNIENLENVKINKELFCSLAGITKRTLSNWNKNGKVEICGNEVIVPKNQILILNKEVLSVGNKIEEKYKIMLRKKVKASLMKLEKIEEDVVEINILLKA